MAEILLRQPRFTHRHCIQFTKNKDGMQKFNKQEIQDIFMKQINKLNKLASKMIWLIEVLKT